MILRSLILLLPLILWAWLIINPRWTSREITATFLGFVWVFHTSLVMNITLVSTNTLNFRVDDSLFYGVPLDWVISQSVMMGALAPLARIWSWNLGCRVLLQTGLGSLVYFFGGVLSHDVTLVPIIFIVVVLCAMPAMFLSDWTATDSNIGKRAFLQSLVWALLLFWFFPSLIFHLTAENWAGFLHRGIFMNVLFILPLLLPGYLLVSALYHFAVHGDGTAFPYDPPKRLVTQGVYQYISNPMQVGISLAVGWWGVVIQSIWLSVSAIVAVILFIVFRDVCNGSCAIGRNNPEWDEYQRTVRKWWPRSIIKQ